MNRAKENVDEELQEELLIIESNAVINPWAMMVHPSDAAFTNRTVMAKWWFDRLALLAVFHHYILQVFESWIIQDNIVLVISSYFNN